MDGEALFHCLAGQVPVNRTHVSEDVSQKTLLLPDLIVDAVDAIDVALEEKTRERIASAHQKLKNALTTYQEVLAASEGAERAKVEQRFERRITDLRRQAS